MTRKIYPLILGLITSFGLHAQNSNSNTPVAGIASSDNFAYNGHTVSHYGLGWYAEPTTSSPPVAYFSAYGGLKFFTQGQPRAVLDGDGKFGVGTLTPGASLHVVGGGVVIGNSALVNNTEGALSIGNLYHSFSPTASNWSGSGSNLILSAQDYSSIAFHHYGNRVDFIRAGAGTIQLGYDGGWGMANIGMPNGVWNSAGNVGIGTLTPKAKLHVAGTILAAGDFANLDPNQGLGDLSYLANSASLLIGCNRSGGDAESDFISAQVTTLPGGFAFYNYSPSGVQSQLLRIKADGNIGIGINVPREKVEVFDGNMRITNNAAGNRLMWYRTDDTHPTGFTSDGFSRIGFITQGTEKAVIDVNGYLGIGTLTPQSRLHVKIDNDFSMIQRSNRYSYAGHYYGTGPDGAIDYNFFTGLRENSDDYQIYNGYLGTNAITVVRSNSNVGIGTSDPKGYKLAIAGSAVAESITVKLQGNWPDYVFKKDYQLPTLPELQDYIQVNHHLPEMPSAKEVSANGLNLGEINKLLTKKVEELTLYLIEKDKAQKELEEKFKKLEAQVAKLLVDR